MLFEALEPLTALPWTLTVIGSLKRDPDYAKALVSLLNELDLTQRVKLVGELDQIRSNRPIAMPISSSTPPLLSHMGWFWQKL